jgi:GH24 family phage-related lysozyme (muramidase)
LAQALGWTLTQGQHDALVDFCYECGDEALTELTAHGQDQVPVQLPRWVHAIVDDVETVLPGMVTRRATEVQWWNS